MKPLKILRLTPALYISTGPRCSRCGDCRRYFNGNTCVGCKEIRNANAPRTPHVRTPEQKAKRNARLREQRKLYPEIREKRKAERAKAKAANPELFKEKERARSKKWRAKNILKLREQARQNASILRQHKLAALAQELQDA